MARFLLFLLSVPLQTLGWLASYLQIIPFFLISWAAGTTSINALWGASAHIPFKLPMIALDRPWVIEGWVRPDPEALWLWSAVAIIGLTLMGGMARWPAVIAMLPGMITFFFIMAFTVGLLVISPVMFTFLVLGIAFSDGVGPVLSFLWTAIQLGFLLVLTVLIPMGMSVKLNTDGEELSSAFLRLQTLPAILFMPGYFKYLQWSADNTNGVMMTDWRIISEPIRDPIMTVGMHVDSIPVIGYVYWWSFMMMSDFLSEFLLIAGFVIMYFTSRMYFTYASPDVYRGEREVKITRTPLLAMPLQCSLAGAPASNYDPRRPPSGSIFTLVSGVLGGALATYLYGADAFHHPEYGTFVIYVTIAYWGAMLMILYGFVWAASLRRIFEKGGNRFPWHSKLSPSQRYRG